MGKLAFFRLYNGTVRNRDVLINMNQGIEEKVTQIRKMDGCKAEDTGVVYVGDIAALCGLSQVQIGDILGDPSAVPPAPQMAVPLLTVQVYVAKEQQYTALVGALQELTEEDPLLDMQWLPEERELHVKVMGSIQLEILTSSLLSRFGLQVEFGQPSVIYKETPAGRVKVILPTPCLSLVGLCFVFLLNPGREGIDDDFFCRVSTVSA